MLGYLLGHIYYSTFKRQVSNAVKPEK